MSATISFNQQSAKLSYFPTSLQTLKAELFSAFQQSLPGANFDLKFIFPGSANKSESIVISTETDYRALLRSIKGGSTIGTKIEIIPRLTRKEKRDIVIIEDEANHKLQYVNFSQDANKPSLTEEKPKEEPELTKPKISTKQPVQEKKIKTSKPSQKVLDKANEPRTQGMTSQSPREKVSQEEQKSKMKTSYPSSGSQAYNCDSCGRKLLANQLRYRSTGIEDYDLCENCFHETQHPYPMIEYVEGRPTRKIDPRRYVSGYERSPFTSTPFGGYNPMYQSGYTSRPNYGGSKRSGLNDFFPFRF